MLQEQPSSFQLFYFYPKVALATELDEISLMNRIQFIFMLIIEQGMEEASSNLITISPALLRIYQQDCLAIINSIRQMVEWFLLTTNI